MIKPRFFAGEQFTWKGRYFEVIRGLPTDEIIIRDTVTTTIVAMDLAELVMRCVFERLDVQIGKEEVAESYPEELMTIARFRKEILDTVMKMPTHNRDSEIRRLVVKIRTDAQANGNKPPAISRATIYRWLNEYEKSNYDVRSLVPDTLRRGGKGKPRLPDAAEQIMWRAIEEIYFASGRKATVAEVRRAVNARIAEENHDRPDDDKLPLVSRRTVLSRMQGDIPQNL